MLPNLEDILKMRQSPTMNGRVEAGENDAKRFVFVAEYLVGAVLGKKEWESFVIGLWNISWKQIKPSYMSY
jgi:hypothetical protein